MNGEVNGLLHGDAALRVNQSLAGTQQDDRSGEDDSEARTRKRTGMG